MLKVLGLVPLILEDERNAIHTVEKLLLKLHYYAALLAKILKILFQLLLYTVGKKASKSFLKTPPKSGVAT